MEGDVIIVRLVLNVGGSRGVLMRLSWGFRNDWLLLNKSSSVYVEISGLGVYRRTRHEWRRGLTMSKSLLILLVVLNGVMSELRFKYDGVRMELQGSRLGFNICVAPSSVKLGVLEFMEVGVGSELDRS